MGKFGVGLTGVIIFGTIGALFGGGGMLIGIILGIMAGFGHDPEEAKEKEAEENEKNTKKQEVKSLNPMFHQTNSAGIYVEVVTELMAACITADATIEQSEIDLATSFIESDDIILDKNEAFEKLKDNIDDFFKEREKSKAIFKLKMTSVAHKANQVVSSFQKERILVILDGMLGSIKDGNKKESEEFVEKIRQLFSVSTISDSKQLAAEQYILSSGNAEAISSLREMQKNPNTYKEKFKQAAKGNPVMKTALGVFTGVIAANLVTSVIYQHQLSEALSNFDAKLESMGGIDNMLVEQDNNVQFAGLDSATEDIPYSEEALSADGVQIADAGEIGTVGLDSADVAEIGTDGLDVGIESFFDIFS